MKIDTYYMVADVINNLVQPMTGSLRADFGSTREERKERNLLSFLSSSFFPLLPNGPKVCAQANDRSTIRF